MLSRLRNRFARNRGSSTPRVWHAELAEVPDALTDRALRQTPRTDTVLVNPSVIGYLVSHAARYKRNEIGEFLIGRQDGRFLRVERCVPLAETGTATRIHFRPKDFTTARNACRDGQSVVGWAHSHPTYGCFMSDTDLRHQSQSQELYPDYVALVVDPFRPDGIEFGFFRCRNGESVQLKHHYYAGGERGEA